MREIKFRAWAGGKMFDRISTLQPDSDGNFSEVCIWPEGDDLETKLGCTHQKCSLKKFYGNVILMQFAGLHDRNGKEIYEGDIIRTPDSHYTCGCKLCKAKMSAHVYKGEIKVVEFLYGRFCTREDDPIEGGYTTSSISSLAVVLGNIHENPDLLPAGWKPAV